MIQSRFDGFYGPATCVPYVVARPADCVGSRLAAAPCECLIDDYIYTINNNLQRQRRYRTRFLTPPTVERHGIYRLEKHYYACVAGERLRFC